MIEEKPRKKRSRPEGAGRKAGLPKTGGRKNGSTNLITRDLKDAILNAFVKVGGEDYLVWLSKKNPAAFSTLLGKILPTQLTGLGDKPLFPVGSFVVEVVPSGLPNKAPES
jgi:hypothetical protein